MAIIDILANSPSIIALSFATVAVAFGYTVHRLTRSKAKPQPLLRRRGR